MDATQAAATRGVIAALLKRTPHSTNEHLLEQPAMTSNSRRNFLIGSGAAITLLSNTGCANGIGKINRQPNIIFIMADDLGYADIGVYGQHYIKTPHIDSLAQKGLMLTNGYANSSICSPTRTALLTGRYQHRFPVGLLEPLGRDDGHLGVPKEQKTMPSRLRDLGYHTSLIGKWHLGDPPVHGPLQHGYDHFFGFLKGAIDYFQHRVNLRNVVPTDSLYDGSSTTKRQGYLTNILGDETVKVIEGSASKPFFISLHFSAPHFPWEGAEDEAEAMALKDIFHREGGSLKTYAAMVQNMDDNVGKVIKALEKKGIRANTLIVFTSDNGGERFSNTWPFTGVKGELLEGGIRVPLIVQWPQAIKAGQQSEQTMISMDFAPTLLAAAGGAVNPAEFDGINLLPVLLGQAKPEQRTLFWRYKSNGQAAVRQGNWKYLKIGSKEHLFDVARDPRERAQIKTRYPEKFAELKKLYQDWEATMLPYPEKSFSEQVKDAYPDRY